MLNLRARRPHSTLFGLVVYAVACGMLRVFLKVFYRLRTEGTERVPASGPALIAANHQSFLDPPAIGVDVRHRQLDFVARGGLFRFKPFGWAISQVNSIPLREDAPDTAAIKEIIRRLEQGSVVMIFPEGSRTEDGAMTSFSRGVAVLVKRAKCPVIPAAIEGAYDVWPRSRKFPKLFGRGRIAVRYGNLIPHDELFADGPDAALRRLEREIDAMRIQLRAELRERTGGRLPAPGPGDRALRASDEDQNDPAAGVDQPAAS
ncbi:MAG: 1-acyl-sn-glycerol-3-phosphate acyltransferase [Phycisphaerales bacterium]|nr:MAG: 1-acyl-sn-glycerol-3-phosphate acyltransferase [Phycisphaerales bacterium]